jgi:hypothetical protein
MENADNPFEVYHPDNTIKDFYPFLHNYKIVDRSALLNISLNAKEPDKIEIKSQLSKSRHILSIYAQKNKKRRENIYAVESKATIQILSKNKTIPPESGILKNGDLELLDSPEESFKKLKNHIGRYALFFDYDESKRTPVNAYFYNASIYTQYLPNYNCLNGCAISGNNSAYFDIKKGNGYILFNQKLQSGVYEFSFVFSGKSNTTICILYDLYKNKAWNETPLATYTISNNNTHRIRTSFSVGDLNDNEFFLVGAWVNGEAYLDNFCLIRKD